MKGLYTICWLLVILAAACKQPTPVAKPDFLTANIDSTVNPADDFFLFANGGWLKRTPIPDAESGWGLGNLVEEDIYNRLRKVNEDAAQQQAAAGSIARKIGDFWFSGMDTTDIDKQGGAPLRPELKMINDIQTKAGLVKAVAAFHLMGIRVMFTDYVSQDDKNSAQMAFQIGRAHV